MTHWLRGKRGGFLALLFITALVVGGLGWMTALALRLEEQQRQTTAAKELSQAETDQAHKVRLALWRLDTHVYSDLAREANRPYHEYSAHVATIPTGSKTNEAAKGLTILELLQTRADDSPVWMCNSYLVGLESDWQAPHALRDDLIRHLNLSRRDAVNKKATAAEASALAAINRNPAIPEYLHQVRQQDADPQAVQAPVPQQLLQQSPGQVGNMLDSLRNTKEQNSAKQMPQLGQRNMNYDPDTQARVARGGIDRSGPSYNSSAIQNQREVPPAAKDNNQSVVILGPMTPLWLSGGQTDQLVLARLVQLGRKPACQVTVLDWPLLEAELLDKIRDLLPEARLAADPLQDADDPHQERAMTALPVKLDPGPVLVPASDWDGTSLRYGFTLAWAAALAAMLAVALGGWALLDLSERRIRFVSAVTHELRTPLTSLRLYLDMLTSGLVTDEQRKAEYLHTLNQETDRLNRLVGNVLDFSRLENQRPKLSLAYVTTSDLLYQVRATWEGRCQDNGKELVIDNTVGADCLLYTDEQMVQQILGNLIDNACKYSRGAEDPRIVVRARAAGASLLLEVEDRGPGVPASEQGAIFRAFRRGCGAEVTAGGVGLGLALAQRWAYSLGGQVTLVPATQGIGACFRIMFPGLSA